MARESVRKLLVVVPDRHLRASLETLIGLDPAAMGAIVLACFGA